MRGLPDHLPDKGLLVGWSLEPGRRKPAMGFVQATAHSPANTLEPILDAGEGHLITVAPTGAGKGTGCIIPALLRYDGPVVVVDPKGENYAVTAQRRRAMGQQVVLLDPFEIVDTNERHRFNPLDLARPDSPRFVEDVSTLADLAARTADARQTSRDPFWSQMGRSLITAMLLDVLLMPDSEAATLPAARNLLNRALPDLVERAKSWHRSKDPELRRLAALLANPADETLGGYWAYAINELDYLKGHQLARHLSASDVDLNAVYRGDPLSIYLVLPPDKLESHAPLLRLWIGTLISVITRRKQRPDKSTLFLIDEAAQLGEMPQLRQAITLLRGYGVRVWSFWQDLSQMRQLYADDWHTIINNCRIQQFFGAVTGLAADAVVEASGFGPRESVLDLARDEMILNVSGDLPVVARKPNYRSDPAFIGLFEPNPYYANAGAAPDTTDSRPVFIKSEAPATTRARRQRVVQSILANRVFHPTRDWQWRRLHGEDRVKRLNYVLITAPAIHSDPNFEVSVVDLPFYPGQEWCRIEDRREQPSRFGFYVVSSTFVHVMTGKSDAIYELNEKLGLEITRANVSQYVEFFTSSITSDRGRFLIVESADELDWVEAPDKSLLLELGSLIRPARLIDAASEDELGKHFAVDAEMVYGTTLFSARFLIERSTGEVSMVDEKEIASDLAVVDDVSRLPFIGLFHEDGRFCSFQSDRT